MDSSNWIQRKFKKFNTDYVSNVIIILSMDFNDMALDPSNVILYIIESYSGPVLPLLLIVIVTFNIHSMHIFFSYNYYFIL